MDDEHKALLENVAVDDYTDLNDSPSERISIAVDDILDRIGVTRSHLYLLLLCGFGYSSGTVDLISVTLLLDILPVEFYGSLANLGLISLVLFVGQIIGSLLWGSISDKFGRRFPLIVTAFLTALFAALTALSPSFIVLLVLRFLMGFGMGASLSLDFVLMLEFFPSRLHKTHVPLIILFGIFGVILTAVFGFLANHNWRLFVFLCSCPNIITFLLALFWRMETPHYLIASGKIDETRRVLQALCQKSKNCDQELLETIDTCEIHRPIKDQESVSLKSYTLQLLLLSLIWFSTTIAYYGWTIWLSKYSKSKQMSVSNNVQLLIIGFCEIPGLALAVYLLQKLSKLTSILIFSTGCFVSSLLFMTASSEESWQVLLYSCCLYFFIVGVWTNVYMLTPEIFPVKVRSFASGLCGLFATIGGALSGLIGGILWDYGWSSNTVLAFYTLFFIISGLSSVALKSITKANQ